MSLASDPDQLAIATLRMLCIDAVQEADSAVETRDCRPRGPSTVRQASSASHRVDT
jgi:hypothetical protein